MILSALRRSAPTTARRMAPPANRLSSLRTHVAKKSLCSAHFRRNIGQCQVGSYTSYHLAFYCGWCPQYLCPSRSDFHLVRASAAQAHDDFLSNSQYCCRNDAFTVVAADDGLHSLLVRQSRDMQDADQRGTTLDERRIEVRGPWHRDIGDRRTLAGHVGARSGIVHQMLFFAAGSTTHRDRLTTRLGVALASGAARRIPAQLRPSLSHPTRSAPPAKLKSDECTGPTELAALP